MPTVGLCAQCGAELSSERTRSFCVRCLFELGLASGDLRGRTECPEAPTGMQGGDRGPGGATPAPAPETVLRTLGDYDLLGEIGRGGMGVVYRARQRSLGRIVAVKMLAEGSASDPERGKRLRREAEAMARLEHAHIVTIHETGTCEGGCYFSMEFAEGGNLASLADGPWEARRAAEFVRILTSAIQHAHDRGVVHRDLKPSNILLDAHGSPRVADFGLAAWAGSEGFGSEADVCAGTPSFMPPEQAEHGRDVGVSGDVYGLGATLYFLLTGSPPFVSETHAETLRLVREESPVFPNGLADVVPTDLARICLKCLEKRPADRYPSADALGEDLDRFLAHRPVSANPLPPWLRWARRAKHPGVVSSSRRLALAAVLVWATAWIVSRWRDERVDRGSADDLRYEGLRREYRLALDRTVALLRDHLDACWTERRGDGLLVRAEELPGLVGRDHQMSNTRGSAVRYAIGIVVADRPSRAVSDVAPLLAALEAGCTARPEGTTRLDVRLYPSLVAMAPDLASGAIDVALGELPNLGYLGRRLQHAGLEVVASAAFAADPWEMVMPWEGGVRVLRSEPILATGRVLIASPRVPADVVGEMRAAAGRFWVGGPTMSPSNAARERVPIRLLSTVQTSGEALPGLLPVGAASRVSPVREVSAIESWEERGKIVHHALGGGRLYRFRDGMDGTGVLPRDGAREPQPRRRAGRWELGDGLDATKRVFVEQCLPKRVYPVPPELLSEAEAFLGAWERALLGRAQVAR